MVEYLTKWVEAKSIDTCTKDVATKFVYENIITIFGCPITLISDQGTHFVNGTIKILMEEFLIDHRKTSLYQPQANEAIESFNKTLPKVLTKVCGVDKDNLDNKVPTILWAYRTTYKQSTRQTRLWERGCSSPALQDERRRGSFDTLVQFKRSKERKATSTKQD